MSEPNKDASRGPWLTLEPIYSVSIVELVLGFASFFLTKTQQGEAPAVKEILLNGRKNTKNYKE